jgi:hypothetical protein
MVRSGKEVVEGVFDFRTPLLIGRCVSLWFKPRKAKIANVAQHQFFMLHLTVSDK